MHLNRPTAIVYIDGLNLYKQTLEKNPEYKWLNPLKMCEIMLPSHEINLIRYFTSRISPPITDPDAANRQDSYLRALESLEDKVTLFFGKMTSKDRLYPSVPLAVDDSGKLLLTKVRVSEEKGSDVALASHMVFDAATRSADLFVLVSNDSDFAPTLELLSYQLDSPVALFSPSERPSRSLLISNSMMVKIIRTSILKDSQFEDSVMLGNATIRRPDKWC